MPVSASTVTPVSTARLTTTTMARCSKPGLVRSGSERGPRRISTAMRSAIITRTKIALRSPVKIQNSRAISCACGPFGSSADCQPRQPDRTKARAIAAIGARPFIAASLRHLAGRGRSAAAHRRERRGAVLGRAWMHRVVTARRGVTRGVAAHGADVGGDLPDLVVRDLAAEGRHAVRAALADRVHDVLDRAAIDPDVVH